MSKVYYAVVSGAFINGAVRQKGDSCGVMTDREAKYMVMSGLITATKPRSAPVAAEPDPTLLGKKTR